MFIHNNIEPLYNYCNGIDVGRHSIMLMMLPTVATGAAGPGSFIDNG